MKKKKKKIWLDKTDSTYEKREKNLDIYQRHDWTIANILK